MLNFDLSGIEDAVAAFRRIGSSVTDDTITPEAMKALEPVLETARQLVPRDTDELHDSLVIGNRLHDAPERGKGGSVYVGVLQGQALHGWFVEGGTVHMQAQPFLGPAFEQHRDLIVDVLGKGAGRLILNAN